MNRNKKREKCVYLLYNILYNIYYNIYYNLNNIIIIKILNLITILNEIYNNSNLIKLPDALLNNRINDSALKYDKIIDGEEN